VDAPTSARRQRSGWSRAAALLGVAGLPAAWLASLSGQPDHLTSNLVRVAAAIFVAGAAWAVQARKGRAPRWKATLVAGVVGSLALTALSVFLPALGTYTASGWVVSGLVGGAMVALAGFGLRPGTRISA
jgi:peptidoglycan/LPS O-acetylase OafA/YrhL